VPIKAIARHLGIARNTVRAAVRSDGPPKYERRPAGSAVDAFEPLIRELLKAYPTMPATVIAERVGWARGLTILKDRVRETVSTLSPPGSHRRARRSPRGVTLQPPSQIQNCPAADRTGSFIDQELTVGLQGNVPAC